MIGFFFFSVRDPYLIAISCLEGDERVFLGEYAVPVDNRSDRLNSPKVGKISLQVPKFLDPALQILSARLVDSLGESQHVKLSFHFHVVFPSVPLSVPSLCHAFGEP